MRSEVKNRKTHRSNCMEVKYATDALLAFWCLT